MTKGLERALADAVELTGGPVGIIHAGKPCLCGPGFCALDRGLAFYGYCNGSREVSAPDCLACGAPHQSDAGCWLCTTASGKRDDPALTALNLRMLKTGVKSHEIFDLQDSSDFTLSLEEALDIILSRR